MSELKKVLGYKIGDFETDRGEKVHFTHLHVCYPKEGVNIFVDSICVPKCNKNYEAAMMFINFLCEPEIALQNAERICYTSPHTAVVNDDRYTFKGDEILYPKKYPKTQFYENIDKDTRTYYEKLWEEVKRS